MAKLKVPSLQHLARNWRDDPKKVKRALINVAMNAPNFTYDPLFSAVADMLVFKQPYEEIVEGIRRNVKRPAVRDNFLEVLPLLRDHFLHISPTFVQGVARRFYPVGRDLMVPFEPPIIYGLDGRMHLPWLSFWRRNPLEGECLSLFMTVIDEVLAQDPELETAIFTVLDFSMPGRGLSRELTKTDSSEIPRLTQSRKLEMLEIFAEGFALAQQELSKEGEARESEQASEEPESGDQAGLFDRDQ